MMKKWKIILTTALLTVLIAIPTMANAKEMEMMDYFKDAIMVKQGAQEYVQLKQISASLGYELVWNGKERSITITYKGMAGDMMMDDKKMDDKMADDKMTDDKMMSMYKVKIVIGSKMITVNNEKKTLMVAPIVKSGRTLVTKDFVNTYMIEHMKMMDMESKEMK